MFNIGFFELLVVVIVALLVLGPERLPKVFHVLGRLLGRGRRFWQSLQDEIDHPNQKPPSSDS